MKKNYEFDLAFGKCIEIIDPVTLRPFNAEVIGVDHYQLLSAAAEFSDLTRGMHNKWCSYTLVSDDAPDDWGMRFWAVDSQVDAQSDLPRFTDMPCSFSIASPHSHVPDGFVFEPILSGRVDLYVQGEALHVIEKNGVRVVEGALNVYRRAGTSYIWAEEVFQNADGLAERMVF